ncbi:MAG: signal peptidase I [Candidatus Rokubacteria bacterium 13_1_40CM_69_27]|nr:MAG: signal peptidase I [Candidatus Rokubacteria bacterium 13_1_40CM_69_27]OLE37608.1 MAG: signal peptidase I [Candidatus Rokubacteria bacterium 13_1_20CM_2_70_7]
MGRAFWLVALGLLIVLVATLPFAIRARLEGFSVPSPSMVPTLLPGDYFLVDKSFRSPRRGDVIVFRDPHDAHVLLTKRVVGLGGEELSIVGRDVYINCRPGSAGCAPLAEPYAYFSGAPPEPRERGPYHVPNDAYFVLADNRNKGEDSRHYGFVRWDQIAGRPLRIYWSWDPEAGSPRWGRLGHSVR